MKYNYNKNVDLYFIFSYTVDHNNGFFISRKVGSIYCPAESDAHKNIRGTSVMPCCPQVIKKIS